MSDIIINAFYEYDFALAMAKVALRMTEGYEQQTTQQAAVDSAQSTLDHLAEAEEAPADLADRTRTRVLETKALYEKQMAQAQELLDLPDETKAALSVNKVEMQIIVSTAVKWISAFMAEGY